MSERNDDPLLKCLHVLCKQQKQRFNPNTVIAGLPLSEGKLSPVIFPRAASRVNFQSKLIKRKLKDIHSLSLPCILLLKNNQACVYAELDEASQQAKIIIPNETTEAAQTISLEQLQNLYAGFAILLKYEKLAGKDNLSAVSTRSWFWKVIYSYRNIYGHIIVIAFLTNLFALLTPLFIMSVYDRILPNKAMTTLWVLAIGLLVFFCFDFIARMLRNYLLQVAGDRSNAILSRNLFAHILNLKLKNRPSSAGSVIYHFSEFDRLSNFFTSLTLITAIDVPFIILFLLLIWWIAGSLVVIPILGILLSLFSSFVLEKRADKSLEKALQTSSSKNAILAEAMVGIEAIKTMTSESSFQQSWEQSVSESNNYEKKTRFFNYFSSNISVSIQQIVILCVVVYGVYLINATQLTVGGLIAVTILSTRATMLVQITALLNEVGRSKKSLTAFNKIMSLETDREAKKEFLQPKKIQGDIRINNVSFYYPKQTAPAVNDLDLSIKAQEHVAIIGRTGSGKTTLLKLISGLYQPTFGTICIDGLDNQEIDPAYLRRQAQYINGESKLFSGTIRDNLLLAKPNATDEEILQAAKTSGLHDIVSQYALGYDTPVGERGDLLSSGQRQMIILCRSILIDPRILLLDDPTSAIDIDAEKNLIKELKDYLQNKTLILVTHRVSLLELVDRIIILDNGKIVADGPKNNILERIK